MRMTRLKAKIITGIIVLGYFAISLPFMIQERRLEDYEIVLYFPHIVIYYLGLILGIFFELIGFRMFGRPEIFVRIISTIIVVISWWKFMYFIIKEKYKLKK
jgi:hypothetical protein